MKFRTLLLSAALIGASSLSWAQQGTPEEQSACRPDVRRYCAKIPQDAGASAFLTCLQEHREKLSVKCRGVLESHGV
jgi:hypothetical protein